MTARHAATTLGIFGLLVAYAVGLAARDVVRWVR